MIISRHQVLNVLKAYGLQPPAAAGSGVESGAAAGSARRAPGRDRVELSAEATAVRRFTELARQLPDVRADRVEEIRQRLAGGEYRVDPHAVAERMLYRLLADRAQEGR